MSYSRLIVREKKPFLSPFEIIIKNIMSTNKHKQLKIKFDDKWHCCSNNDIDMNIIMNTISNSNNDLNWISIYLPHIIDKQEQKKNNSISDKNESNWWYYKEFEWKADRQNADQRIYLIFETLSDHNIASSIDMVTIWLNQIQIFSGTFQSLNVSIDLTDELLYKNEFDEINLKNLLIIYCKNMSLCLHTYLLIPHSIAYVIEQENIDIKSKENSNILPLRKNRVLDYLVRFNNNDGRFNIDFSSKLGSPNPSQYTYESHTNKQDNTDSLVSSPKQNHVLDYLVSFNDTNDYFDSKSNSPILSTHQNLPNIIVSEDDNKKIDQIITSRIDIEDIHVPRLAIVMLIVGSRGDVQPFVA